MSATREQRPDSPATLRGRWAVLKGWLALSRIQVLPTVWSNCLAGWWLGGGGNTDDFGLVIAGATLLYLGGAFLHDAFDEEHDGEHHPYRPIPSGVLSSRTVWRWGLGWLIAGALCLFWLGPASGGLGLVLVVFIVLTNAVHRLVPFSPVLTGVCRLMLYLLAASVAVRGITGWAVWCGLALGAYMTGLGFFSHARAAGAPSSEEPGDQALGPARSRSGAPVSSWSALLLVTPIVLALLIDDGPFRESGLLLSVVVGLWCVRALRHTFWSLKPDVGRTVAELTTGIVLVDWLAAADAPRSLSLVFLGLAVATIGLRRISLASLSPRHIGT